MEETPEDPTLPLQAILRGIFPQAPLNHSTLVVSSEDVRGFLQQTPLKAALDADFSWVASKCADYVAAVNAAAQPFTVFSLPAAVEGPIDDLAASVGQTPVGLRYLLALLAAYPLGLLFSALRHRQLKNLYMAVVGVYMAQVVFPSGWAHAALSAGVAYGLLVVSHGLAAATGVKLLARWAHLAVFGWMMGYMTVVHLYRLHTDYMGWSLDFSGPQMLLTIKLTALGFNMYDGLVAAESYRWKASDTATKPALARIYRDRLARAVTAIPDPLTFAGYVFCFTGFFAGPAFEFAEYERSVSEAPFQVAAAAAGGGPSSSSGKKQAAAATTATVDLKWGSRVRAAAWKLLLGLCFLGVHMAGDNIASFARALSFPVLHGPATSLLFRIGYLHLSLMFVRMKYYFAWLVSEGSSNAAGFGYDAAKGDWSGVCNMDVLDFETACSATAASKAWNKNTASWLGRYCNQRLPQGVNMWATYALSAVWHGFYPGYYLFFLSAPLLQNIEKAMASKLYPRVAALGGWATGLFWALSHLAVPLGMNYFVIPFVALGWNEGITGWASLYYGGHLITFALMLILAILPPVKQKTK